MKTYKFELTITQDQLEGDEMWEGFIREDPTAIKGVTEALEDAITASNPMNISPEVPLMFKLIEYTDD